MVGVPNVASDEVLCNAIGGLSAGIATWHQTPMHVTISCGTPVLIPTDLEASYYGTIDTAGALWATMSSQKSMDLYLKDGTMAINMKGCIYEPFKKEALTFH